MRIEGTIEGFKRIDGEEALFEDPHGPCAGPRHILADVRRRRRHVRGRPREPHRPALHPHGGCHPLPARPERRHHARASQQRRAPTRAEAQAALDQGQDEGAEEVRTGEIDKFRERAWTRPGQGVPRGARRTAARRRTEAAITDTRTS